MTIRTAPSRFMCKAGARRMARTNATMPAATSFIERSRSVRKTEACAEAAALKSDNPERMPCRMIGNERTRLMMPPAATAPAPI